MLQRGVVIYVNKERHKPQVTADPMANTKVRTLVGIGILAASIFGAAAVVGAGGSPPHNYPPVEPARVECTALRPANEELCYKTANNLPQLFELILEQFAVGDVANATQETLPTTPQVFPDGPVRTISPWARPQPPFATGR